MTQNSGTDPARESTSDPSTQAVTPGAATTGPADDEQGNATMVDPAQAVAAEFEPDSGLDGDDRS